VSESNKEIIIVGYSGHSYVVINSAINSGYIISGYTERKEIKTNPFHLKYLGNENNDFVVQNKNFIVCIGDNNIRNNISNKLRNSDASLINIIDTSANVSKYIEIGTGNYIGKNVSINAIVKIKNDTIINTASIIEHECKIDNAVHIGPGTVLCGNVKVGENTFIGANSVVKQGVCIGGNVTIGAGSVVIRDIPDNQIWAGNPAKRIK
jgi:sugar O-acyltransferase (sialic acid O-acetyltransferase NeuD family)